MSGRVAIVTGGAGHLGGEISDALAELGASVVVASRDVAKCERTAVHLRERYGHPTLAAHVDLTNSGSIDDCLAETKRSFGKLDILVMAAWSGRKNSWETINDADWIWDIDVCLTGVYRMIRCAFPMLKETRGVILTIGSMYGHVAPDYRLYEGVPQANPPSYGAAKAGVIQLTKYLASFLSPYGIRANCLSPGPFPFDDTASRYPEFIARLNAKNPLGRTGRPHEIKGAAALLCSDAGSYITGQNVCVDGGWTAW